MAALAHEIGRRWKAYDWNQGFRRALFALLLGAVMGLVAVLICTSVTWATNLWAGSQTRWILLLLPLFALLSIVLYERLHLGRYIQVEGAGKNYIVEDINANRAYPVQAGPAMFIGTLLALAGGASVGPEGAAKEMGASIGCVLGRWFGLTVDEEPDKDAIAFSLVCGMASCFAALLMAPLGIFIYALVRARHNKNAIRHWPTIALCVYTAAAVAFPFHAYFTNPAVRLGSLDPFTISATLLLALAVGLVSVAYHLVRRGIEKGIRPHIKNPYVSALIGASLITGLFLLWSPAQETGGLSIPLFHEAFSGTAPDWAFAIKILITAVGLGFGLRGGEVTVLLVSGAALGCAVAHALYTIPICTAQEMSIGALCALGMVGLFGVGDHCPLAAVMVGAEFFGIATLPYMALTMMVAWIVEYGCTRVVDGSRAVARARR